MKHSRGITLTLLSTTLVWATASCGGPDTAASHTSTSKPSAAADMPAQAPAPTKTTPKSLAFGEALQVKDKDWQTDAEYTATVTVTVTPGTLADLSNFELDAQQKTSTPFYVSFTSTNTGSAPATPSVIPGNLFPLNEKGARASRINLVGAFPKCPSKLPETFAPGATIKGCDVYMVPTGQKVAKVTWGSADEAQSWAG